MHSSHQGGLPEAPYGNGHSGFSTTPHCQGAKAKNTLRLWHQTTLTGTSGRGGAAAKGPPDAVRDAERDPAPDEDAGGAADHACAAQHRAQDAEGCERKSGDDDEGDDAVKVAADEGGRQQRQARAHREGQCRGQRCLHHASRIGGGPSSSSEVLSKFCIYSTGEQQQHLTCSPTFAGFTISSRSMPSSSRACAFITSFAVSSSATWQ